MKDWQNKKVLTNIRESFLSGSFYLITLILLLIWDVYQGKSFQWIWLEVIDPPSVFDRLFYSAVTFLTLGAFLYAIKFYKILWIIIGNWREYKKVKSIIWGMLMFFMYFYGVPKIVDFLNFIISIIYNIFAFVIYVSPFFATSLIILTVYKMIKTKGFWK